jgi:hypothetical protein
VEKVYRHSGQLGMGPAMVPLIGVVAALLLSLAYAYITVYSPIAGYVTILFVAGYAFGLAFVMMMAGRLAKVRNNGFMTLAGLAIGLFAYYCAWASFESVCLSRWGEEGSEPPGYIELLTSPSTVWAVLLAINENGWYTIKGSTPTGMALWIMWGIEAVIVVGATVAGGAASVSDEVFCESCDGWCEDVELGLTLGLPTDQGLFDRIKEGDISAIESLELLELVPAGMPFLKMEVKQCEACSTMSSYQAKLIEQKTDDKGNPTTESSDFSQTFVTDSAGVNRLKAIIHG